MEKAYKIRLATEQIPLNFETAVKLLKNLCFFTALTQRKHFKPNEGRVL